MKIFFKEGKPEDIVEKIRSELGGRKLGEMLDFSLSGDKLNVVIKKMGTSQLEFSIKRDNPGSNWTLSQEKIALSHKVFKAEMMGKLTKIIERVGGKVTA